MEQMKTKEAYYPYEGGGEFVEFLPDIKKVARKRHNPRDMVYQPLPGPTRWAVAELVDKLHCTKDHLAECWDIATQQVYDAYSRAEVKISQISREIYIPC
jgi:hypothetical protein